MKRIITLIALVIISIPLLASAKKSIKYYGSGLCSNPAYYCIKTKGGMSWKGLFPNPVHRDIVQRINRTNMPLWRGRTIAVPRQLEKMTIYDVSPLPLRIKNRGSQLIIVDQDKLAWAAYNTNGELVRWGPISSGKNFCRDVNRSCKTISGIFYIFHKKDKKCESNIFPVGEGGAKMPYCMFFFKGYALHGSAEVPGYRDSHGCVRLFKRDARWLNKEFVRLPYKGGTFRGTKVVVQKINDDGGKK